MADLGDILVGDRLGELLDATCFGERSWIQELRARIAAEIVTEADLPAFLR
ncbi:MAG TPA: hypothetical protein VIN37_02815 [Candidatus Limnocylindria bacterium]